MPGKLPYLPLFTGDWIKDPALSRCSESTRGIWIDLLCAMHENGRSGLLHGTVTELCRMSRSSPACLAPAITELSTYGVAEVQERNGVITIQNRRMVRECHTRENARLRKQNERVRKKSRVSHNASSYSSSISRERPPSGALSQPREAPPEAREVPPADENTSERASKSRFSLKECEQYAASVKGIKQPKAWAKTIWRSGEDDDAIGEFLGNSGNVMKKQPDKPVDVAEIKRLADDLDAMKHHEAAQALRASIQGK